MLYEGALLGKIGPLGLRYGTIALSAGQFRLMKEYNVYPFMGVLPFLRANAIDFSVADEPC